MAQRPTESYLRHWASILDGQGNPTLTIEVEAETGKPIKLSVRDRDTLGLLASFQIEVGASTQLGQALMLADTMKMKEQQDLLSGEG